MASGLDLKSIFFEEAEELLVALDEGLRQLDRGEHGAETINAVFRAVHSIKGGAGAFALHDLVAYAHSFETLLDELRNGHRLPEPAFISVLLEASDHLADLVLGERDGRPSDPGRVAHALDQLKAYGQGGQTHIRVEMAFDPLPLAGFDAVPLDLGTAFDPVPLATPTYAITIAPHRTVLRAGHDPLLLLRDLAEMGDIETSLDTSNLPEPDAFDPTLCYIGWSARLTSERSEAEIRGLFDFIGGQCDITISRDGLATEATSSAEPAAAPPEEEPTVAPTRSSVPARNAEPPPAAASRAPQPEPAKDAQASAQKPTIRVDVERVDRLVNVAGELVIHNAILADAINRAAVDPHEVTRSLDQLRQLSRMIQESAMAIRAQPVKPLFDRMHRILREAAAATGKKVRLEISGENTEVDRTIIERLADPLTHMVRNAVDHGIELPDRRVAAGKGEQGVVRIEAQHRSGRIIIMIADDGCGINRARVRQIAIERGLVPANAELPPSEIDALLFLPGFSTAKEVSALSGRGVGMDVVRSSIIALGGRINISSNPGEGTTMTISLPLTLAVMDGMVIRAGGQPLVLPLPSIVETLSMTNAVLHPFGDGSSLMELRGECLPMVGIAQALGLHQTDPGSVDSVVIIVEREDKSRIALIADAIDDQRQIVIKSLDENYGHISGIAAATVLGDGSVALIVDPAELVEGATTRTAFSAFSTAAE